MGRTEHYVRYSANPSADINTVHRRDLVEMDLINDEGASMRQQPH